MENKETPTEAAITRALEVTETAIEAIREGDILRRETTLDAREAQIATNENMEKLKEMVDELEKKVHMETAANTAWAEKRMAHVNGVVEQVLDSSLLAKDVENLEKKVSTLQNSIIQQNKAYEQYDKEFDMADLKEQVDEMCQRVDNEEKEFLEGMAMNEESIENMFRGAIEALYGVQSTNPAFLERAKKLAAEMSIFRDAAANKNFYAMVAPNTGKGVSLKSVATPSTSSECPFSSEMSSEFSASTVSSQPSDAASSASSSFFPNN